MWPSGAYSPHWVVKPWRWTVIRGQSLLDIKKATLLPGTIQGEHTHCLAPLLWELLFLLLSVFLILFKKRQEKDPFSSRSRTSKFKVNTGIFQKTVHLGKHGELYSKSFGDFSSDLSPGSVISFGLFQGHFTIGWSHTARWLDLPFRQHKKEGCWCSPT